MSERKIGVYVCHCGGNISDYVDVERVIEAVRGEEGVAVARTAMFTCSDATQEEIVDDIQGKGLDGLVVASCSPKLHTFTFRGVAARAGLNPFLYTQVNVREQCSWAHTDDREGATEKAIRLVRAGIARTRLLTALEPTVVETVPKALVVGGGVAGLRAAVALADMGIAAFVVERDGAVGGRAARLGATYPHERKGRELVEALETAAAARGNIVVFTGAELVRKSGSFGRFEVEIRKGGEGEDTLTLEVGAIIVATGAESYAPAAGEYGYGIDGVVTLDEYERMLSSGEGPLTRGGREVRAVAYVYCVGSRESEGQRTYCSRYCCSAAVHSALRLARRDPRVRQYHLYRDMRTYGRYELMYEQSRREGSLYLKFAPGQPPAVESAPDGRLSVRVCDQLTGGRELAIDADLVVLVTGLVPARNEALTSALKLPVGRDGFYNEIHPKLRPVETMVDGVLICGTCQAPQGIAESAASALAAATQAGALLKRGRAELDPQVARVDARRCTGCAACVNTCPFAAITLRQDDDGPPLASVDPAACKGCGGCVPLCPEGAIDLMGYTGDEIVAMIDGLVREVV